MFFVFDGLDGVGKSTQVDLLRAWLNERGYEVVACRDPGSTAVGEALRDVLLNRHALAIHRRSEMLMYMAARAQLVEEVVRPALAAGKVVLSDRYLLANVVYQAHAGGLDPAMVWQVGEVAVEGVHPHRTFVLDMDEIAAAERMNRPRDRMELQGDEFRRRVRAGFLREAALHPGEIIVIDAAQSIEAVHARIVSEVENVIAKEHIKK